MRTSFPTVQMQFSASDVQSATLTKNEDGSGTLSGLPVFRAGTFRDSMGEQGTWTAAHLRQMVENFNELKTNGSFPDPPARIDHTRSMKNVVGYASGLSTDGKTLFADVDLTEPDAVSKWERKTYRARSAEIGAWVTNDEATYYPTFRGFAFVDTGAVSGLFSHEGADTPVVIVNADNKEFSVPEPKKPAAPEGGAPATFTVDGKPVTDVAAVQAHIAALEARAAKTPEPAKAPESATFTVNGAATTDFTVVQAHIAGLEKFVAETRDENRKAFVSALVAANKIGAPQAEKLKAHALTLDDEQYKAFTAVYEDAPVLSMFGRFEGVTNPDGNMGDPKAQEIKDLEEIVKNHQRANLPTDDIAKTKSFQRLQVLKASA